MIRDDHRGRALLATDLPLLSPDGIADLRASAKPAHYPASHIRPAIADAIEAARDCHTARNAIDAARTEAEHLAATDREAEADLRRSAALARAEAEMERAADCGLSLLSIAADRRPEELLDILRPVLLAEILERLCEIETVLAREVLA